MSRTSARELLLCQRVDVVSEGAALVLPAADLHCPALEVDVAPDDPFQARGLRASVTSDDKLVALVLGRHGQYGVDVAVSREGLRLPGVRVVPVPLRFLEPDTRIRRDVAGAERPAEERLGDFHELAAHV